MLNANLKKNWIFFSMGKSIIKEMIYIYIGDSKFSSYDLVTLAISKNLEQGWDRRRRDLKLFFFDISLLLELFFLWKISYSNLLF